jgi:hypothetical protein
MMISLGLMPSDILLNILNTGVPFRILTLFSLVFPMILTAIIPRKKDFRIRHVVVNLAVSFSLIIPTCVSVIWLILSHRVEFKNTGNRLDSDRFRFKWVPSEIFAANSIWMVAMELLTVGFLLAGLSRYTPLSFVFLSGIACGPIFVLFNWDSWVVKIAKYIPIVVFLVGGVPWVFY